MLTVLMSQESGAMFYNSHRWSGGRPGSRAGGRDGATSAGIGNGPGGRVDIDLGRAGTVRKTARAANSAGIIDD